MTAFAAAIFESAWVDESGSGTEEMTDFLGQVVVCWSSADAAAEAHQGGREADHAGAFNAEGRQHPRQGRRPSARHRRPGAHQRDLVVKYRSLTHSVIPTDRQTAIEKTVLNLDARRMTARNSAKSSHPSLNQKDCPCEGPSR